MYKNIEKFASWPIKILTYLWDKADNTEKKNIHARKKDSAAMLKIRVCSQVLKFTRYTIQYDWEGVGDWSRIWDYHPRSWISSTSREVKTSKCKRYFLQHCYISCRSDFSLLVYTPGEDSDMKGVGMLVFSLWGVNFGFYSHLGCSGQNAIIFCRKGLF